ncbi:hypothetical protein AB6A40_003524 [Gnathostoma spinigerum]|uniref:Uncharacterized protein n=1 Tax=Gnathostoma spinigerum TaxID=75299 RepID=A0ABD6EKL7_9BILA
MALLGRSRNVDSNDFTTDERERILHSENESTDRNDEGDTQPMKIAQTLNIQATTTNTNGSLQTAREHDSSSFKSSKSPLSNDGTEIARAVVISQKELGYSKTSDISNSSETRSESSSDGEGTSSKDLSVIFSKAVAVQSLRDSMLGNALSSKDERGRRDHLKLNSASSGSSATGDLLKINERHAEPSSSHCSNSKVEVLNDQKQTLSCLNPIEGLGKQHGINVEKSQGESGEIGLKEDKK